jgi:hypothetical protein
MLMVDSYLKMTTTSANPSLSLMNVNHLSLVITLSTSSVKSILLPASSIKAVLLPTSSVKTILLSTLSVKTIPFPLLSLGLNLPLTSSIKTIPLPIVKLISEDVSPFPSADLSISRTGPSSHFMVRVPSALLHRPVAKRQPPMIFLPNETLLHPTGLPTTQLLTGHRRKHHHRHPSLVKFHKTQ